MRITSRVMLFAFCALAVVVCKKSDSPQTSPPKARPDSIFDPPRYASPYFSSPENVKLGPTAQASGAVDAVKIPMVDGKKSQAFVNLYEVSASGLARVQDKQETDLREATYIGSIPVNGENGSFAGGFNHTLSPSKALVATVSSHSASSEIRLAEQTQTGQKTYALYADTHNHVQSSAVEACETGTGKFWRTPIAVSPSNGNAHLASIGINDRQVQTMWLDGGTLYQRRIVGGESNPISAIATSGVTEYKLEKQGRAVAFIQNSIGYVSRIISPTEGTWSMPIELALGSSDNLPLQPRVMSPSSVANNYYVSFRWSTVIRIYLCFFMGVTPCVRGAVTDESIVVMDSTIKDYDLSPLPSGVTVAHLNDATANATPYIDSPGPTSSVRHSLSQPDTVAMDMLSDGRNPASWRGGNKILANVYSEAAGWGQNVEIGIGGTSLLSMDNIAWKNEGFTQKRSVTSQTIPTHFRAVVGSEIFAISSGTNDMTGIFARPTVGGQTLLSIVRNGDCESITRESVSEVGITQSNSETWVFWVERNNTFSQVFTSSFLSLPTTPVPSSSPSTPPESPGSTPPVRPRSPGDAPL